jgi:hypothetical protein
VKSAFIRNVYGLNDRNMEDRDSQCEMMFNMWKQKCRIAGLKKGNFLEYLLALFIY